MRVGIPYIRALDGLRGVAVAAVLLFHADLTWARGGHLGVSVFFTLSGFLITSLLVAERTSTGRIALGAFWARRARRLVPAIAVAFGLIAVAVPHMQPRPRDLVGDAIASSAWVANWRFILSERTYSDLFASPSPFQHFWSLAVEEQFYVLFPLLVVGVLGAGRRLGPRRLRLLALVLGPLVVGSTAAAATFHSPFQPTERAYFGTDARAAELLVGALLALAVRHRLHDPHQPSRASAAVAHLLGVAGLAGLTGGFIALGERDPRLYEGGLLVVSLCSAAVIVGSIDGRSVAGRLLSTEPLVGLGRISYGAYLFHWPLYLALTEQTTGLRGVQLIAVRIGATLALAAVSYVAVEAPIRHARSLLPRLVAPAWASAAIAGIGVIALVSGEVTPARVNSSSQAAAGAPAPSSTVPPAPDGASASVGVQPDPSRGAVQAAGGSEPTEPAELPGGRQPLPEALYADPDDSAVRPVPDAPPGALRVAVVGDSLGINLATGLEAWADERGDVVVYDLAISACPISRGGFRRFGPDGELFPISSKCGWWDRNGERLGALRRFDPDVVVVQDGVDEMMDRWVEGWDDYYRPGDPRFDAWLRDEYGAAFGALAPAADTTFVVTNAPCGDWDRYEAFRQMRDAEARIAALNTNVYALLGNVRVADLFQRICPGGQYRDEVEGVENGRPDGIHLSDEAAAALARNWLGPIVLEARPVGPEGPELP